MTALAMKHDPGSGGGGGLCERRLRLVDNGVKGQTLGAYLAALEAGSPCPMCGAAMVFEGGSQKVRILVCECCGAEVEAPAA